MQQLQSIKQRFGIIGSSPVLDNTLKTAIQVSPTDLTVLIQGESGTGKEAFSRIIHALSNRKHNNFIAVNCGAIPEGTINSELFGHVKGSYTGAAGDRKGYFETANGGTIFLDEVGEMPLETQTRLLRVLEQGEFIRVGDSQVLKTDVRVVAATNVDLFEAIRKGRFREDLYYRLSTVPIKVPSLRERPEDIYMLFRKFAVDFAEKYRSVPISLNNQAQLLLESYAFPGNIRELKNIAEQISVLAVDRNVDAQELAKFIPEAKNHLPILSPTRPGSGNDTGASFQEREIMFKFLYDMKKDLNDLKALVVELVRTNNLRMPAALGVGSSPSDFVNFGGSFEDDISQNYHPYPASTDSSLVIHQNVTDGNGYKDTHEVEDQLSLEDVEKDYILKSLKKHRGRRKDAAAELGISERTLYRKIKEYNI